MTVARCSTSPTDEARESASSSRHGLSMRAARRNSAAILTCRRDERLQSSLHAMRGHGNVTGRRRPSVPPGTPSESDVGGFPRFNPGFFDQRPCGPRDNDAA